MTGRKVRPRLDQVAELTCGLAPLPLPAIADEHLIVLAEGLNEAFEDLCVSRAVAFASGDEAEMNSLMQARLSTMIEESGSLWGQLVSSVSRGSESISFDGSHLEKRPDLLLHLSERTSRFPLVVEAKILDAANGKTEANYCNHGIMRFVNGEYAWAGREALMMGYVRDGSSIMGKLSPFLMRSMAMSPPRYCVQKAPMRVGARGLELAFTRHDRCFLYPCQVPPNRPGPISIWHLWLR